jgi:RNA polymerase sigma-70 factor (ECF subfamily)
LEKETEQNLITSIQKDLHQFGILFDTYYPSIFNYVFRRIGDSDTTKDVVSETFLKAYLNIGKFQWKGIPISFWLYRIANNEIQQCFRKKKYTPDSLDLMIEIGDCDIIDPVSTLENKQQMEKELKLDEDFAFFQNEIKKLPIAYQEVLALKYFEQKSIKEIAMIINKKEGTIKSLLSRGIDKLRNSIV